VVGVFGQPGDGAAHAAAGPVVAVAQHAPVTRPPQLQQRGRQQRQPAGLSGHVGHQRPDQRALGLEPGAGGRLLDRPRQLAAIHRPGQHVARAHQRGQLRVGGEPAVEIRAQHHHHQRPPLRIARRSRQPAGERRALTLLLAQREQLLQLVDRDHDPLTGLQPPERAARRLVAQGAAQLGVRVGARPEQHLPPPLAARQRARAQRGQHPGAQQRGLAHPRGADDPGQRRLHQPRQQVGDQALAAAEKLRIGAVEKRQPLERAHPHRPAASHCRMRGTVQAGVVFEDRVLELLQRAARL
jgi:hypothetical protein